MAASTSSISKAQTWLRLVLITILGFILIATFQMQRMATVQAADTLGYRDMEYKTRGVTAPTGEKPQSKLWFTDNTWWGNLYNRSAGEYRIYKLDWETQKWLDMEVRTDEREGSKADTLWDGNHLYIASGTGGGPGRLYRYTYTAGQYTLNSGFPVDVTSHGMEALVLAKDSLGTLWVTYTRSSRVYVAHTIGGDDMNWMAPYELPVPGASGLSSDDISAIIAFQGRIGVMWSNQSQNKMYFAAHPDGAADDSWQSVSAYNPSADDHINIKSLQTDNAGNVFAVVKTSFSSLGEPGIVLLVCSGGSCTSAANWQAHVVYERQSGTQKTRPILLIDTDNRDVYVFMADTGGGKIYYKKTSIDAINFPDGPGTTFIDFGTGIDDPSSTKQNLTRNTRLVVIASDGRYYYHNCLTLTGSTECPGSEPPPPTNTPTPTATATASPTPTATATPAPTSTPEAGEEGDIMYYLPVVQRQG
ncbi:MAG TPA: hypothetical protein VF177_07340 [Anaerolineae bacterium]